MERIDELKERIRQQPLSDRLEESCRRIGDMCSKGRCPKMTIPVQHDDDDFYISTTLADAQATIAALQADNRTYINERHENMKQIEQLQAMNNRLGVRVETLESQLTQRTAELEAAKAELNTVRRDAGLDCGDHSCLYAMNKTGMRTNGGCRCSPKRMKNDLERSRKAYDDLQAELERVRGELAETKEEVKCLDEQVSALNQGCLEYELLLKALPRMEGDVEVYHHESGLRHSVVARPANKYYSSFDTPEEAGAYAAILKHRQGMEG